MSRSNATEAFRKLLNERGVEYGPNGEETLIRLDGKTYRIWAYDDKRLVMSVAYLTPEQAIAATLGRPMEKDLRRALDFMRIWISDDAHLGESEFSYELEKAEGLRKLEAIEQAIAATLGSELNPDGLPVGLTISDDGALLNWRGEYTVVKKEGGDD